MSAGRRSVLVTGARGFIGRHCLPLLAAQGFEVHAASSTREPAGDATWEQVDLLDVAAVEALINRVRPTHLLHLAWIAKPGLFWSSPDNLRWLAAGARLVDCFYAAGGTRAVGVGTCAEYGTSEAACIEDATPIAPGTVYGEAKAAMYFALRAAARGRGSWAWARLFFPYGPGEPAGRFIPGAIGALLRREPFACTHGRQVRDFVFVDDVARACVALVVGEANGAYNVGSGQGTSLREVGEAIAAELGHAELLRFGAIEAPAHDAPRVVADCERIRRDLGWSARVGLREGIRSAVAAARTH